MNVQKSLKLASGYNMPIVGLGMHMTKRDEARQVVEQAIDTGYRHVDTALMYGNESEVGQAVKNKISHGKIRREDVFITTKLPPTYMTPERVPVALEKSLKNLDLGYIDLYLVHWPMGFVPGEDDSVPFPADEQGNYLLHDVDHLAIWREMENAVDSGKVRSIGISNYSSRQIQLILDNCRVRPSNLQVECHLYHQQKDLSAFCHRNGITVTGYCSLGNLSGQSHYKTVTGDEQYQIKNFLEEPVLRPLMEKYKKSPAQIILRYLTMREIIMIPKSVHLSRLVENLDIFDFDLIPEDFEALSDLDKKQRMNVWPFRESSRKHKDYPFSDPF